MLLQDVFNLRVVFLSVRKSLLIEQMRCLVTMSHFIQLESFFAYFYTCKSNIVSVLCNTCRKGHSSRLKVEDDTSKCEDEFKVNVLKLK